MASDRRVLQLLAAEPAVMLAAGRALLLQVAHPKIAQGVADHSDLRHRPIDRLLGTLDFLTIVAFGTEEEAEQLGRAIRRMHERITGPGYSGNDPELQVWVNATLIEAALFVYTEVLRSPSGDLTEEYVRQARFVADVLDCPPGSQPDNVADFRRYMAEMTSSLEVSDTGREVARAVLWAPKLRWLGPAMRLNRFITTGLLPERIRDQYGLPWSDRQDRTLWRLLRIGASGYLLVPGPVRRSPVKLGLRISRRRVARRSARARALAKR